MEQVDKVHHIMDYGNNDLISYLRYTARCPRHTQWHSPRLRHTDTDNIFVIESGYWCRLHPANQINALDIARCSAVCSTLCTVQSRART